MPTKTKTEDVEEIARKYFALSSPIRLKILKLCKEQPTTVKKLVKSFDMSANNMSEHIRILHDAGFIEKVRNKDNSVTVTTILPIDAQGKVEL